MASYTQVTLTKNAPVEVTACGTKNQHIQKVVYQQRYRIPGIGRASIDKAEMMDVECDFEMQNALIETISRIQNPSNP